MRAPCLACGAAVLVALAALDAQSPREADPRAMVAERVLALTRESSWRRVASTAIGFRTFHPQGLVKIGDTFYVSSVDAAEGVGHLFKIDRSGSLLADVRVGEGLLYHPGGLDYDGKDIWVAVAEYRPDSRSIVYRVDPTTLKATEVLRVDDHIGALVHDTDDATVHGVSWGSRRFYRWALGHGDSAPAKTLNPSHYVDYQDCKYVARHRMLCTGVTEIRQAAGAPPFRLGGIELVDLREARPLHQVPVLLWTSSGLAMTHNPVWIEASVTGLRGYFMPEDERSTLYVYEVDTVVSPHR